MTSKKLVTRDEILGERYARPRNEHELSWNEAIEYIVDEYGDRLEPAATSQVKPSVPPYSHGELREFLASFTLGKKLDMLLQEAWELGVEFPVLGPNPTNLEIADALRLLEERLRDKYYLQTGEWPDGSQ